MPPATIGFGFSRIVSHKMTYVIFFVKHYVITFSRWIQDGRLLGSVFGNNFIDFVHIFFIFSMKLRACSYDPAYRDVSLTDDLASYLFSYKILHCVHMRKRAGPLAEISFEFAEIIGRRDEIFPYEHASPLTGMKSNKSCWFNLTLFTWFYVCFVNKY